MLLQWPFQVLLIKGLIEVSIAQNGGFGPIITPSRNSTGGLRPITTPSRNSTRIRPTSAPTPTPSFQPSGWGSQPSENNIFARPEGCIHSLTDLEDHLSRHSPDIHTTYTLCADTVFDVGFPDENGACCVGGQSAIYPRSNVTIQCGENGSSLNNCTVRGGQYQLLAVGVYSGEDYITDFEIIGVIFESAAMAGLLLVQSGVMEFNDCIFKNHSNNGAINLFYSPQPAEVEAKDPWRTWRRLALDTKFDRRLLRGDRDENVKMRNLQQQERQKVDFNNCIFEGNTQGEILSSVVQRGIVSVESDHNDVSFERCIFRNNNFDVEPQGYAISVHGGRNEGGSTLNIQNSCFYDNQFTGHAPVQILGNVDFVQKNNAGDEVRNDKLSCQFIAQIQNDGAVNCREYEMEGMCPMDGKVLMEELPSFAVSYYSSMLGLTTVGCSALLLLFT